MGSLFLGCIPRSNSRLTLLGQKRTIAKRAPSIYSLYTKNNYPLLKEKNPEATPQQIVKLISIEWKTIPEIEREKYYSEYNEIKAKHDNDIITQAYAGYKKLLDDGIKFAIDLSVGSIDEFQALWKTLSKQKKKQLLNAGGGYLNS